MVFSMTAENYQLAVEVLRDGYISEDFLLQIYARELLKLVISDTSPQQKFSFSKLETHLGAIKTWILKHTDPATWLYQRIELG